VNRRRDRRGRFLPYVIGGPTTGRGYPPHLVPGNLYCHHWRGTVQVGRVTTCLVCSIVSETRNRRGDARFIKTHKRCGFFLAPMR